MVIETRPGSAIMALSEAHDKARGLGPHTPERVEEVLWDFAVNYSDRDIKKVAAELEHLYHEQASYEYQRHINSGAEPFLNSEE